MCISSEFLARAFSSLLPPPLLSLVLWAVSSSALSLEHLSSTLRDTRLDCRLSERHGTIH